MDEEGRTAEAVVSRSREISEERWTAIQAELDDSRGTAFTALENCPTPPRVIDGSTVERY
jgi:hypothetical protein